MENMNEDHSIVRPGASGGGQALKRVGFGSTEVVEQRETQGMALAARAQAEVQARYIVALQRPRNLEEVRVRILEHCKRRRFAEIAEYAKPVGGQKIRGPSIRFVETALQEYGNVEPDATIIYDDDWKRILRVSLTDLERNITYHDDALVEKFVERKRPKDGDEVLGSRENSQGEQVYRIRATEDDFANKCASAVSKKTRNLGLRILPADITDEAMWQCGQTRTAADHQDPVAARRQLVDRFAELRVMPSALDEYLGHPFDQASPAELDELRAAWVTIRDGEAKWTELVEAQRVRRGEINPDEASKPAAAAGEKLRARIDEVKAKAAAKAKNGAQPGAAAKPGAAETKVARDDEMTEADKRAIEAAEREENRK